MATITSRAAHIDRLGKLSEQISPAAVRLDAAQVFRALAEACERGELSVSHVHIAWDVAKVDTLRVELTAMVCDGPLRP